MTPYIGATGAQRRLERVAPDDARPRHAASRRRQHEPLRDDLGRRLRLQPLEQRRERQGERQHRHHHVAQQIERAAGVVAPRR